MIRSIIVGAIAAAVLTACDSDPTAPETVVGQYLLERFGNAGLPIGYEPQERLNAQNQPVMCVDTLFSQSIHLRDDSTLALVSNMRRFCAGSASAAVDESLGGTYTVSGDSITLRFKANTSTGVLSWSWAGALGPSTLTFSVPAYTEMDPDRNSFEWVYRRSFVAF
jgi:hypothetical protein